MLAACSFSPRLPEPGVETAPLPPGATAPAPERTPALPGVPALQQTRSRWVPVPWSDLPGFSQDALYEAWNA
jgi:membrane-bound lytic murein transglycosylase A